MSHISRVDDRRRGRGNAAEESPQFEGSSAPQRPKAAMKGMTIAPEDLPDFACSYCNYHEDPACVAKCHDCGKWFCNGKGQLTVSHIVAHLAKAKHKQVGLHETSDAGDDIIECYVCDAGRNVFDLGVVPADEEQSVVMCREPCLHSDEARTLGVDAGNWVSLIENRQIIQDICNVPKAETMDGPMVRPVTSKDVQMVEDAWRIDKNYTVDEALEVTAAKQALRGRFKFMPVPKQFRDGNHLRSSFAPLLADEMARNQEMDDGFKMEGVDVMWRAQHGRQMATFVASHADNAMSIGRQIGFRYEVTGVEFTSTLIRSEQGDKINETIYTCELGHGSNGSPPSGKYSIFFIFNPVTFERMENALLTFAKDNCSGKCCSKQVYNTILGNRGGVTLLDAVLPEDLNAPGLSQLNDIQRRAVGEVLLKPFSLIQGPPGTGKTTTTATICYHLSRMYHSQILVCAPSNIAVDELTARISKTGLKVVRVVARSREDVPSEVEHLGLHSMVEDRIMATGKNNETLRELISKRKEQGTLNHGDYEKYIVLKKKIEESILSEADVICCTSAVAADKRLEKFIFRHVVIDESTQSHEAETLIPVTMGAEQVILVGDHCQMGPVVMSRDAGEAGLSRTTFERLATIGHKPYRLEIQYRMHPELSKFSSNMFYEGTLQNGVTAAMRDSSKMFGWPDPTKPFFFYHTTNPEEMGSSGMSVLNRREAHLAEMMLSALIRNKVDPSTIGVITPYEAQRNYLIQHLDRSGLANASVYKNVEVASVDSFQGREKEYIILSCVRSNNSHAIGFLKDWRRMNVALTRAKKGVMVIGNADILADDPTWNSFLLHCKSRNLIVQGSVMRLEPVQIDIRLPRKKGRNAGISEETLKLVRGDHAQDTDEEGEGGDQ